MKIKLGMNKVNMSDVSRFCGGDLYDFTSDGNSFFEYVCTDSREADENTMFVATRGERVDGHDYIAKAIELGCRCILCEYVPSDIKGKDAAFVVVENSIDAFSDCAKGYREGSPLPSVAITGSVGKTTTKELCAAIFKKACKVFYTEGNFNSVIGMPMSLMSAEGDCEAAIFEMGMSGFGEIGKMTRAATPMVAMVTNIGSSHLEYLRTRENIAKAKLEIGEGIVDGGYLLLNGDEPLLEDHYCERYETVYVGYGDNCAYQISCVTVDEGGTRFDLRLPGGDHIFGIHLNLVGKHFAYNASFAAAAAHLMGIDVETIREGLEAYVPSSMRMNISKRDGVTLIADCYNAAPESMRGAIDSLTSIKVEGKRIAVLGDMKELGERSDDMHRSVGSYLSRRGIDMLFTLGSSAAYIADAAIDGGMNSESVISVISGEDKDRLAYLIKGKMKNGDAILFKASRSMRLEEVIASVFEENK